MKRSNHDNQRTRTANHLNQNDLEHPDPENQSLHVTEQKRSIQSAHTTVETTQPTSET
jgi:hypothetical protein